MTQKKRKLKGEAKSQSLGRGTDEIDIDELPWQQVSLPDRLDDAEGFFGLEEIDGVQVIKNGSSGRPHFKVYQNCSVITVLI